MTFTAQQSRVDALLRLMGLIVLAFGLALIYLSYTNSSFPIAPAILTINYSLGIMLTIVGLLATFSKFK
ncbi:MAG: hypothetical protein HY247_07525 [archaeon]|nr:MAG: hypothetical protein HY247_07525 [archaeon]